MSREEKIETIIRLTADLHDITISVARYYEQEKLKRMTDGQLDRELELLDEVLGK